MHVVDEPAARATGPTPTRWSPTTPGRGADGPGRRLRPGAAGRPRRRRRRRGALRPARPGRRRRPGRGRPDARHSARPRIAGLGRPARVRGLLRGARGRCATRSAPSCPAARARRPRGGRRRSTSARACAAQLAARTVSPSSTSAGCTREAARPATPTGATGPRPAGWPAWSWLRADQRMSRRDEIAAGLDAVRARIAAACADAGRLARRRPPGRGHQDLPGLRRAAPRRARGHRRRREPAPGGRGQGRRVRRPRPDAGTSSAACRATRRPPSRRTPTSSSRSTGASWSRRSSRGAHRRSHPVDVLLQVSLDPPGRERPVGRRPGGAGRARRGGRGGRHARLRGLMAVAPLGEDPAAAFGRLADVRRGVPRRPPRRRPGCRRG